MRTLNIAISATLLFASLSTQPAQAKSKDSGPVQTANAEEYAQAARDEFVKAERAMSRRNYEIARRVFRSVTREYPFSSYASIAELRIADSYFEEKSYYAATKAYKAFTRLRPRHEKVPYADFQVVECYRLLMPRQKFFNPPVEERDLTDAILAYREARRYIIRYPDGEYTPQVRDIIVNVANRLADHEMYAATFYERRGKYPAAVRRYHYLLDNFPETDRAADALLMLAKAAQKDRDLDEVQRASNRLEDQFPDAEQHDEMSRVLQQAIAYDQAHPDGEEDDEEEAKIKKRQRWRAPAGGGGGPNATPNPGMMGPGGMGGY